MNFFEEVVSGEAFYGSPLPQLKDGFAQEVSTFTSFVLSKKIKQTQPQILLPPLPKIAPPEVGDVNKLLDECHDLKSS